MKKNVASQSIGAQLIAKADGTPVTSGTTTVYVTGDNGTQAAGSVGSGACTHEGNGYWSYAPAQAETNYDHVAFTFVNTNAVNATVQVFTTFPQTGDNFSRIGAAGAGLTALGDTRIANLDAAVSSRSTYAGGAVASVTGNVGGNVVGSVASVTAGVTVTTNNDKTGYALSSAGVQAIWDALTSALTTVGSIGKWIVDKVDVVLSTRLASSSYTAPLDAAGVRTAVGLASANLDTQLDALPTAAENADAVWDEARADHTTSGTFGQGAASVQGNVTGSVASVSGAVGSVTGNVGGNVAGSVGSVTGNVGGNVTGSVGSLATQAKADVNAEADAALSDAGVTTTVTGRIDAAISTRLATAGYTAPDNATITLINNKTTNLPSDPADQSLIIAATDAVMARLGAPAGASLSADIAALDTVADAIATAVADKTGYRLSPTGVNDILRTALTEGYAAEGATVTLEQAVYMIVAILFNRDVAGTELTARKLDGSTAAMTFTLDDADNPTSQVRAT